MKLVINVQVKNIIINCKTTLDTNLLLSVNLKFTGLFLHDAIETQIFIKKDLN